MNDELILAGVSYILRGLEVDLDDRNYKDTPDRVLRWYKELLNPRPTDAVPFFGEERDEMVVLRNHATTGICPHHLLPVEFTVSVGYIPQGNVVGLSKLARMVNSSLDKPLLQETLAPLVADRLMGIGALGAGCIVRGRHGCMRLRGVKTSGDVVTSAMRGVFLTKPEARAEFLDLVRL